MTQETNNPKDSLNLKLPEAEVSSCDPWGDDVLGRAEVAGRLTNIIRDQSAPFTISIHGYWGTGKTFMLKRWQQDLENQDFQAIYFNAWEDDFCDDPLLAIIGQLAEHFQEGKFKVFVDKVGEAGVTLLKNNLSGVLNRFTGLTLDTSDSGTPKRDLLQEYLDERRTKDKLKEHLSELSSSVRHDTNHPLVFIIDELDRCRPTFAIELLERVKHIFDVPDLVFVFGINRDELCKSLASVYGDIDVDVYLRRFFDMEFTLPAVDSAEFGRYLMRRFGMGKFFEEFTQTANHSVHINEYGGIEGTLPDLWSRVGLSLRDIDYCVRLIALVGKNLSPRHSLYPLLLGLLIALKLKDQALYRRFTKGECLASGVIDYFENFFPDGEMGHDSSNLLARIEVELYAAERRFGRIPSLEQLKLLSGGSELTEPQYLAKRTKGYDQGRITSLAHRVANREFEVNHGAVGYLASMIDLHQEIVRR